MKHVTQGEKQIAFGTTNMRKINQLIDFNEVLSSRSNKKNILGKSKSLSLRVLDSKSKVQIERQIISKKLSRIPF
jgi:hypothetical protein